MGDHLKYCFVFVCQKGDLEIKSLLLAASLKRFLRGDFELVAAIPTPVKLWGEVSDATIETFNGLDVRSVHIKNPIGYDYPIGNKLACLDLKTTADYIIFMDSDMICLQEFSPQDYFFEAPFYAKPADLFIYGRGEEVWPHVYEVCGESLTERKVLASVGGELMMPYFNAGFMVVDNKTSFASMWRKCALLIDDDSSIDNKRPWLDQIALPVALVKAELDWVCLDERFNFPLHLKPLNGSPDPFFCHYHSPDVLRREPLVNELLQSLVAEFPVLAMRMREIPSWERLLRMNPLIEITPKRRWFSHKSDQTKRLKVPDLIITGLPRSGTSYLCSLLHKMDDVVAINEPGEIFSTLQVHSPAWGVAIYYSQLRSKILDGLPIQNKLKNGKVVEDTSVYDVVSDYYPKVGRPDFLLCSKNTLAYLARIQQLRQAMPHAPIVVCVRHPLDAIASWKATFEHLGEAKVDAFPVGGNSDDQLSVSCQARLQKIDETDSHVLKRALLWEHLAGLVQASRQDVILVHYEELVVNPREVLQTILDHIPIAHGFRVPDDIEPSSVRKNRQRLTDDDIQVVHDICSQRAIELGYSCIENRVLES